MKNKTRIRVINGLLAVAPTVILLLLVAACVVACKLAHFQGYTRCPYDNGPWDVYSVDESHLYTEAGKKFYVVNRRCVWCGRTTWNTNWSTLKK